MEGIPAPRCIEMHWDAGTTKATRQDPRACYRMSYLRGSDFGSKYNGTLEREVAPRLP